MGQKYTWDTFPVSGVDGFEAVARAALEQWRTNAEAMDTEQFYFRTALTGGAAGALDAIDGADLLDGDRAFVVTGGAFYVYELDDASGAAEASPDIIAPDVNAGTKRWLVQSLAGELTADTINEKTTGAGVTVDGVTLKDGAVDGIVMGHFDFDTTDASATVVDIGGILLKKSGTDGLVVLRNETGNPVRYFLTQNQGSTTTVFISLPLATGVDASVGILANYHNELQIFEGSATGAYAEFSFGGYTDTNVRVKGIYRGVINAGG
ncbi:MAG: hypothetical protein OEY01_10660 [Desulfobulbaceae bacterium]|nr:hypothetical protein [Desulfobulbaceae bacterium]